MSKSVYRPLLPIVAMDVITVTKRGRCYECECVIYTDSSSYSCFLCSTPVLEGKEKVRSESALICSSPECVKKHCLRDQHDMCGCKTCLERKEEIKSIVKGELSSDLEREGESKLRAYVVDPRCYCCNQLPALLGLSVAASDDARAFTVDGHGVVHRGHVWDNFSEMSSYLTWCGTCPSPPFDVKPIVKTITTMTASGRNYQFYSNDQWSIDPKKSGGDWCKNESMRRLFCSYDLMIGGMLAINYDPTSVKLRADSAWRKRNGKI